MDELIKKVNKSIVRIANGEIRALDSLYCLTSGMLYLMAKKYLYDKSYAEDLVSEVYLTVAKKADTFDAEKNGLNWLYKIIHNAAINHNIKDKSRFNIELNEEIKLTEAPDEDALLNVVLVEGALNMLSCDERHIIRLKYWEGFTLKQIAEELKLPLSTAYDAIGRVLKKLKKLLAPKKTIYLL